LSAKHIVIAVGGRPVVPDEVPGAKEHAITSDDIFIQDKSPGTVPWLGSSVLQ